MAQLQLADRAAVDFVLSLRRRWADTLYPAVRAEWDAADAEPTAAPAGIAPPGIALAVHALPAHAWFAWMERGAQKMLWRATADAVANNSDELANEPASLGPTRLELDPDLLLPDWYTDWDIHLQPGGVWSGPTAARVYELGAKLVMLGENDDYGFHRLFVETALPRRDYRRIVDMGCGFGKSAWPMQQAFPDAVVTGVDLSAPCLQLATARANARGLAMVFRQADAADTGLEAGSFDLVTSTMLIHEVPLETLAAIFREAARLLRPGGLLRFMDFQPTGDAFRDLAIIEHGARNNEPFMPPMLAADVPAMAAAAGLINVGWTAFDERGAGLLDGLAWPDRLEWHFPWAVLAAEKPQ
ncbi:class I SAM-dependent methyltransferase [Sandarakinorhabdus limnophila]|uniref:class I SAM-dependent methyltransferase n=1 Tax=Sandarakinorhabdus limnophila TaxID=210512 RepID=UPI0026ED80A8|nr:class I SAM-dependent methyltransferase [Sandarakinorhabdus limnophila]